MDLQTKTELFHMYQSYKRELWKYTGESYESQLKVWFDDLLTDHSMTFRPVRDASRNVLIGFFVVQKLNKEQEAECGCKWFISEAYILPSCRKRGFMTAIVHDFIASNKGNIGLVTIDKNTNATKFWEDTLGGIGYSKEKIPHLGNKVESFYRFKMPVLVNAR